MKKLIIINGVMGVGKTTISRALNKKLENSFWLDGDNCWMMHPFTVNDENKKMVISNITYILNNFINNSFSKYVIFNWVIDTDDIMDIVLKDLNLSDVQVYKITLMCSKELLIKRISKDIQAGKRDESNIRRSLDRLPLYEKMNTIKVYTDKNDVDDTVNKIIDIVNC